jgi:hypothetical protein
MLYMFGSVVYFFYSYFTNSISFFFDNQANGQNLEGRVGATSFFNASNF